MPCPGSDRKPAGPGLVFRGAASTRPPSPYRPQTGKRFGIDTLVILFQLGRLPWPLLNNLVQLAADNGHQRLGKDGSLPAYSRSARPVRPNGQIDSRRFKPSRRDSNRRLRWASRAGKSELSIRSSWTRVAVCSSSTAAAGVGLVFVHRVKTGRHHLRAGRMRLRRR